MRQQSVVYMTATRLLVIRCGDLAGAPNRNQTARYEYDQREPFSKVPEPVIQARDQRNNDEHRQNKRREDQLAVHRRT